MLPVLVDLPFIKIYTYGVFLVLALFWGSFLLWKHILLTSYREEDIFDSLFVGLFGGIVVSRAVYVLTHWSDFGFHPLRYLLINGYPGLSLYGFLLGAGLTIYLYIQTKKIKPQEALDYFIPGVCAAIGFGKLGAFFSGAEVGSKTGIALAIKYVGASGMRHLTPLYQGILFFAASYVSSQIIFAVRRGTYPRGAVVAYFLWFCGLVLGVFDLISDRHTMVYHMSLNLIVSATLLLTFSMYFLYYFRSSLINIITHHGKTTKNNNKKV